ncbi:hypothetical protein O6H91_02G092700 [Diphasiastrum complanatum]|uniref:Uncharacterized protein n=1 Tax=Diphasiastrum complanatum TaxID=34168 RepID=A0ACC2EI93_DIPCM|nr:hypothetical protein O6H91_02G092700 [Diphasiastrum complanatum]
MEESAKKVEKTANNNTKTKAKEKAKVGHGSSMFSEKIDEVSRNAIWREHCAKSTNQQIISSHYTLNPLTAIPIPEKPNRCHPSIKVTQEEYEEAKAFLGNTYTLKNTDLTPPEKYEVPITTSHEYGWCSKPLVRLSYSFDAHAPILIKNTTY